MIVFFSANILQYSLQIMILYLNKNMRQLNVLFEISLYMHCLYFFTCLCWAGSAQLLNSGHVGATLTQPLDIFFSLK